MDNKKCIFRTRTEHLAHLIKGALEANDIETVMLDQHDSTQMQFGDIELYVSPENEAKALKIIADNQNE